MENFENYRNEKMTYMCLKKCLNDISLNISEAEKNCISRCTFKFVDCMYYGNRVINAIE